MSVIGKLISFALLSKDMFKTRKKKVAHPLISLKQSMKSTEQLVFLMSEMEIVWEANGTVKNV